MLLSRASRKLLKVMKARSVATGLGYAKKVVDRFCSLLILFLISRLSHPGGSLAGDFGNISFRVPSTKLETPSGDQKIFPGFCLIRLSFTNRTKFHIGAE